MPQKDVSRVISFTKADRITKRSQYIRLSKCGRKTEDSYFIALFCPGRSDRTRLGVTVTRKVGRAVTRNRIKRLSREYFRKNRHHIHAVVDISIIAKKAAADLTSEQVFSSLEGLLKKISGRTGD